MMEVLIWLENAILLLVFGDTASHERTMLLIFYTEYTERVLDYLSYPQSTMGNYGWARRKSLKIEVLRWPESSILRWVFANTVNASYMFFELMYKRYVAINSSKNT